MYVRLPDGYRKQTKDGDELVAKLQRAQYGFRHALRRRFESLESLLLSLGFFSLNSDPCAFISSGCIILVHVDDMLFLGPATERLQQTKYIHDLLSRFDMMTPTSNARTVPMTSQVCSTISTSVGTPLNDPDTQRYQQIIGFLQRLSCMIRPDITFATSLPARDSNQPTEKGYAILRVPTTKQARFLRNLLDELPARKIANLQQPLVLHCDSTNAIANMNRPEITKRSSHIDAAYHFVHDAVQQGWIKLVHVGTQDMAADGLTKALDKIKHADFTRLLGLTDSHVHRGVSVT
ncbi:Retrovirus-related Pol polyprotein from transposon TNT 1-94 [Ceratocystis lukuohia]|uniref:Retrovirus-related Pol polyprotein from transposon TNT 1-94 n=1 Tax=Ceratocystis lukuohia TaxID=2019550 RepID=A0ABR4MCU4_9PEZI